MITRVVQENMDERQHRIERLDRLQQPDRRGGVDSQGLDHPGLAGLQIDRAVNVDALTPARLLDREGIQEIIVALDERPLLLFIELARNDTRLVILQPQTMQERDQSRAAFINEPEFLLDPGADLTGRTRQCSGYPRLQIVLLLYTQIACAPAHIEAGDAFDPALLEELAPAPDRVVIKEQRIGDLLTAPPFVQKHQGISTPRYPARRRPVARQRRKRLAIFFAEEPRLNHARNRIRPIGKCKKFISVLQ